MECLFNKSEPMPKDALSHKDKADILGLDFRTDPVVHVVVQKPVAGSEHEISKEHLILHHVERVEHVRARLITV